MINFIGQFQSAVLATIDEQNKPFSSYAPFVRFEHRYYILISDIARHAENLKRHPVASLFFIEDEASCSNIFARKRVTLQCDAAIIPRGSELNEAVATSFKEKFDASMVAMLMSMQDFNLYSLTPFSGEAVFGFGEAYDVTGDQMDTLTPRQSAKGHTKI